MVPAVRRTGTPRVLTAAMGLVLATGAGPVTGAAARAGDERQVMLKGSTTASYFWDDGSGRAGDTGLPASGKPMQKGLAASPSWPLLTEGYVLYNGRKAPFFVGDRGPGEPSDRGVMLDLDAKTFAELTGGTFNADTLNVDDNGGKGHIKVTYVITEWGPGAGRKNHPVPFSSGAYKVKDTDPAEPVAVPDDAGTEPATTAPPPAGGAQAGMRTPAAPPSPGQASPTPKQAAGTAAASSAVDDSGGIYTGILLTALGAAVGGAVTGRRLLGRHPVGRNGSPPPRHPAHRRTRGRHRRTGGRHARPR
ncbi:hypothetical protein [Planobispora takensis]|uniref:Uncharacterized protein n=1 Tax=Planobispora takensis TaxID=1367882 RepID=A0A8J3T241_9ACTN|nr:hypothetical protein [Planobispora takensis]GII04348.1 hypothetical protein Pta02_63560 [Planobispora takensis]